MNSDSITMNQSTMCSLSNSIYSACNAISSYHPESYNTYTELQSADYRMEESPRMQYSDFMNNDSNLDADILQGFAGSGFQPLAQMTLPDVDMSTFELMTSVSHDTDIMGSEGTDDLISDYSDSGSCFSENYDNGTISIMEDKVDYLYDNSSYQTEDLISCQPMKLFTPDPSTHDNPSQKKKPGRKKGQTSKVLHLWEFIRDLLKDPKCNGRIIQWENKQDGVFRVVKSSEVASLWGQKKKNKKEMTYEKMSRSMRYSRREGYFIDLPKNSGYPKKLCFRFGPKSTGWQ